MQIQIPTDRTSGTRTRATQMLTNTIVETCSTPLTTAPRRRMPFKSIIGQSLNSQIQISENNNVNTLLYTDDLVTLAASENELQEVDVLESFL